MLVSSKEADGKWSSLWADAQFVSFREHSGAREGCGAEEERSVCVLEVQSGVVPALVLIQFWRTLGIKHLE